MDIRETPDTNIVRCEFDGTGVPWSSVGERAVSARSAASAETAGSPKQQMAPGKFRDPNLTAKGEVRASVALNHLTTLWFNTGTLCNITPDYPVISSGDLTRAMEL